MFYLFSIYVTTIIYELFINESHGGQYMHTIYKSCDCGETVILIAPIDCALFLA